MRRMLILNEETRLVTRLGWFRSHLSLLLIEFSCETRRHFQAEASRGRYDGTWNGFREKQFKFIRANFHNIGVKAPLYLEYARITWKPSSSQCSYFATSVSPQLFRRVSYVAFNSPRTGFRCAYATFCPVTFKWSVVVLCIKHQTRRHENRSEDNNFYKLLEAAVAEDDRVNVGSDERSLLRYLSIR